MNYFKLLVFLVYSMFFITATSAMAAALPMPGVTLLIKSIISSQVVAGNADNEGNFSIPVKEENGAYNVFVVDENAPPVKLMAKNSVVTGRIVILTDGTTTKDPIIPVPKKKPTPIKTVKPVVKKKN